MKRFLLHVSCFALLVFGLFLLAGLGADTGLKQSYLYDHADWRRQYAGRIQADLLVLGNSHAQVQVDPFILDTALHLNAYNLGMSGCQFDLAYARYKAYRRYNKAPRCLLLVMDDYVLYHTGVQYNKGALLPYLSDPDIAPVLQALGEPLLNRYLPFLKYFRNRALLLSGLRELLAGPLPLPRDTGYKGYKPHAGTDYTPLPQELDTLKIDAEIDPVVFSNFARLLRESQAEGVQCVLVVPPVLRQITALFDKRERYWRLLNTTAQAYGAVWLNYTGLPLCASSAYFYTPTHLNKKGAGLFTVQLAGDLRTILRTNL